MLTKSMQVVARGKQRMSSCVDRDLRQSEN